jgi:phospholipid/cholesterol/gamma-HCH transport system substrate-binding protein
MVGLEGFTGGDVKEELLETARSMKNLTENLDKRTAEISVGLTKFSSSGLREYEQLAVDARRTLAELGRAIRNFDRNPQRVLFGAGSEDEAPPAPRAQSGPRAAPKQKQAPRQ